MIADLRAALTFKLSHEDLSHYNAVQKLLYTGVILAGVVIVLSGLSIWKPVQFQELTALFGGYDTARCVFPGDGGDRRFPRCARGVGAGRAEELARDDHGPVGENKCANAGSFPVSIRNS